VSLIKEQLKGFTGALAKTFGSHESITGIGDISALVKEAKYILYIVTPELQPYDNERMAEALREAVGNRAGIKILFGLGSDIPDGLSCLQQEGVVTLLRLERHVNKTLIACDGAWAFVGKFGIPEDGVKVESPSVASRIEKTCRSLEKEASPV